MMASARALVPALFIVAASVPVADPFAPAQSSTRHTLAPDESFVVPDTSLTIVFEDVESDSRCPVRVTCVWAGDAVVRLRLEVPRARPVRHTLHTSEQLGRAITHEGTRIQLVTLEPLPSPEAAPLRHDYRLTLAIERSQR